MPTSTLSRAPRAGHTRNHADGPRRGTSRRYLTPRAIRRRRVVAVLLSLVILITPVWWSIGSALTNPGLGTSVSARLAEWARGHGGASMVTWIESEWYAHHPPPVGGKPQAGAIPVAHSSTPLPPPTRSPARLPAPAPIVPFATPAIAGEGQWQSAGRTAGGVPAVYETYLRPDAVHTSVVVGVAWMDTTLLRATLYSGSTIPGDGPWQNTAPISSSAAATLVAAFNAGFRMSDAEGGYYTQGTSVLPLRQGAASFVIYRDGSATIGQWGRDVSMTPNVVAVRQNLGLLVDGGKPVPGLNAVDTSQWGYTLGNQVYVWRSGVGVTANGALVYVGGPDLNITDLANVLVRAGAVRAMELDINTDWVNLATFDPASPTGPASPANGTDLLASMAGAPNRYFEPWWSRDFFTMSVRPGLSG